VQGATGQGCRAIQGMGAGSYREWVKVCMRVKVLVCMRVKFLVCSRVKGPVSFK